MLIEWRGSTRHNRARSGPEGRLGASQVCGALDRNAAVSCAGATRMAGARAETGETDREQDVDRRHTAASLGVLAWKAEREGFGTRET